MGRLVTCQTFCCKSGFPQTKLLSHPRCLAFVTHGGMNSVTQGTYAGVPMLSVPLFADQTRNAAMIESRGIGIRLNKFELTADVIADGLRKILDDPKYKTRARELSALIHAKPMGPDERILRYAEFAAQHDVHSFLDMYGRQMDWVVYNNVDIFAILLVVFALTLYALRRSYSFFFSRPQTAEIRKKLE
ncbi:Glucuronosyltransferase [Aphelenchoides fujianensis]|nr:Glucuronosyltransferase [Aphelenchoides fujianensis]